jgi:hypothetical protein
MRMNESELGHLVFLAEVVKNGNKKGLMEETYQILLYIVKGLTDAELPDSVGEQVRELVARIEAELRDENDRIRDIRGALTQPSRRNPLG